MSRQKLVEGLNDQLNREVTTFLRYMVQAAAIKGAVNDSVRKMYLEEVIDEVNHAQYLCDQIIMLGGHPELRPELSRPPEQVRAMLETDSAEEATDVKNYLRLASLAEAEGLIALKMRMEEQAADEDEHGHEMLRLLG
jgi:bacterioferritin